MVEDEGAIREMIAEVLSDEGFNIIKLPTADAAIELLEMSELSSVRLIVTDINLPGRQDGIDLAVEARRTYPGIPVIFISGRPAKLADAYTALGDPVAFLQKPFTFAALLKRVESSGKGTKLILGVASIRACFLVLLVPEGIRRGRWLHCVWPEAMQFPRDNFISKEGACCGALRPDRASCRPEARFW